MPASYPKPDEQRRNRVEPKFGWTDLPAAGRPGKPPPLPSFRKWNVGTRRWWAQMWASPQAIAWKQDGSTMVPFALVMDDLIAGRVDAVRASPEIRQHQDRHGLNPKAMLQLRWRVIGDGAPDNPAPGTVTALGDRRDRLRVT